MESIKALFNTVETLPLFMQAIIAVLLALVLVLSTTLTIKRDFGHKIAFFCGLSAAIVWLNHNVVLSGAFLLMSGAVIHYLMHPEEMVTITIIDKENANWSKKT